MQQKNTRRGFTLIELLVAVLIIAILAAVAIPQYNKVVKKAQGKEVLIALDALDKALMQYHLEHGRFVALGPDCLFPEEFSIAIPNLKHFLYYNEATGTKTSSYQSLTPGSPGPNDLDFDCSIKIQSLKADAILEVTWNGQTGERSWPLSCFGKDCFSYFDCETISFQTVCGNEEKFCEIRR